ncbi:MAG: flavodoxin [Candidatus Woesearchaeota archaeon]
MKKSLVVYYSRTGTTKKVAKDLARLLKADQEQIVDTVDHTGFLGYLRASYESAMKKSTIIRFRKDPSKYDLVVVGTPIWSFTVSSPVRTYLKHNKFNRIAFFCTMGGSGDKRAFTEMESVSKKPIAVLGLRQSDVLSSSAVAQIKAFAYLVNKSV